MNPLRFGNGMGSGGGMSAPGDTASHSTWTEVYNAEGPSGVTQESLLNAPSRTPNSIVLHPKKTVKPMSFPLQRPAKPIIPGTNVNTSRKIGVERDDSMVPKKYVQPFDLDSQGTGEYYFAPGQAALTAIKAFTDPPSYQDDVTNYQSEPKQAGGVNYIPYSGESDFLQKPETWKFRKKKAEDLGLEPYPNQTNAPEPPNLWDIGHESLTSPIMGSSSKMNLTNEKGKCCWCGSVISSGKAICRKGMGWPYCFCSDSCIDSMTAAEGGVEYVYQDDQENMRRVAENVEKNGIKAAEDVPSVEEWLRSIGDRPASEMFDTKSDDPVNTVLKESGSPAIQENPPAPKEGEKPVPSSEVPPEIKEISEGPLPQFTQSQIDDIIERMRSTQGMILHRQSQPKPQPRDKAERKLGDVSYSEPDFVDETPGKKGQESQFKFTTQVTNKTGDGSEKYQMEFEIGKKAANSRFYSLFPSSVVFYVIPKNADIPKVSWPILSGEFSSQLTNFLWTKTALVRDAANQVGVSSAPSQAEKVGKPGRSEYNVLEDESLPKDMPEEERIFTTIRDWDGDDFQCDSKSIDPATLEILKEHPASKRGVNKYFQWQFVSNEDQEAAAKKDIKDKGYTIKSGEGVLMVRRLPKWKRIEAEVQKKMGKEKK